jgi:Fe-S cluster assembly protein SufD
MTPVMVLTVPENQFGAEMRRAAMESFTALGFPTTKNEEWRFTNLAPFLKAPYEQSEPARVTAAELDALPFTGAGAARLVFVNGRYAPELSSPPAGVTAERLSDSPRAHALVGSRAAFDRNAMVALNTALMEDGAYIEIAGGAVVPEPVWVVFVAAHGGRRAAVYPRNLIVAGRDSQASIVETYVGLDEGAYFTNAVTEVVAGDGAVLEHHKLQTEGAGALHFHMLRVEQGASSRFASHNIALGSALARNEIAVTLAGEGGESTLNGLYLTTGEQHVDNHTTLDHARPHTSSRELYKGILDDKSQAVFHGRIIVRQEGQKTDAIQRNKNLLLAPGAVINTKPQLEIYADDVRCTHGATVGQVDQDAVFYLRSRGIGLAEARSLLTYAFTSDVIEAIKVEAIRGKLRDALFTRLSGVERR